MIQGGSVIPSQPLSQYSCEAGDKNNAAHLLLLIFSPLWLISSTDFGANILEK